MGMWVVCSFLDDVYKIADWLGKRPEFEIVETKDYIAYPKPNGYRSLHLVLSFPSFVDRKIMAEIQLRTIATGVVFYYLIFQEGALFYGTLKVPEDVAIHDTLCPEPAHRVQGHKAFVERAATE